MVRKKWNASELFQPNLEEKYIDILRLLADLRPVSKTQIAHLMFSRGVSKQAVFKWVDELKTSGLIEPVTGLQTPRGAERFDLTLRGLATLICSVSEQESEFFSHASGKYRRFLPDIFDFWQPLTEAGIDDIARRQLRKMCKLLQPASNEDLRRAGGELRMKRSRRAQMARLQPTERPEDVESKYGLNLDQGVRAVKKLVEGWTTFFAIDFWLRVDDSDYKRWIGGIRSNAALSRHVARAKLRALSESVVALNGLLGDLGEFTELLVAENFEQEDSAAVQELAQQIASLNEASKRMLPDQKWNRIRHALHSLGKQRS